MPGKLTPQQLTTRKLFFVLTLAAVTVSVAVSANAQNPMQIYGAWHCGSDFCTWASVRDMTDFDTKNHWLIDRGDGSGLPSVNLVVLSFVQPLKLLNRTTDSGDLNGVPVGMNTAVVNYFTTHNVRVMLSIGGITYTTYWDQALTQNATQLGLNAAALAKSLGVGIEIDYENSSSPNIAGLQAFINAYRSQLPYDATGANPAARLTIDLAAGDRYLIGLCQTATANWLTTSAPVLDYANAMVPNKQPTTSGAESNWQEHIDGKPHGEVYRKPVHRDRAQSGAGVHELQRFVREQHWSLRRDGCSQRGGDYLGHARLYVLGRRMSGNEVDLHDSAEHVRGRSGCGGEDVCHSHPDATAAAAVREREERSP